MSIHRAHLIKLKPAAVQAVALARAAGTARFAYLRPTPWRRLTLRLLQKPLSRKVKGSSNRKKAALRVGRLHERIANLRNDALHKLTTYLAAHHDTVVIEDLHVKGMVKNSRLAKSLHDASFGEFRRQLEYKVEARGGQLIIADRWFPSSKTCSCCGGLNAELKLSERSWACSACGAVHDRDLNAAKNLLKLAVGATVSVGIKVR